MRDRIEVSTDLISQTVIWRRPSTPVGPGVDGPKGNTSSTFGEGAARGEEKYIAISPVSSYGYIGVALADGPNSGPSAPAAVIGV